MAVTGSCRVLGVNGSCLDSRRTTLAERGTRVGSLFSLLHASRGLVLIQVCPRQRNRVPGDSSPNRHSGIAGQFGDVAGHVRALYLLAELLSELGGGEHAADDLLVAARVALHHQGMLASHAFQCFQKITYA